MVILSGYVSDVCDGPGDWDGRGRRVRNVRRIVIYSEGELVVVGHEGAGGGQADAHFVDAEVRLSQAENHKLVVRRVPSNEIR